MIKMNELLGNFWFLVFASTTIISVACALIFACVQVHRTEAATRLTQAMLARGLSVDEMERLLRPPAAVNDERHIGALAQRLSVLEASGDTLQTVLEAFQAADPATKRLLSRTILSICAEGNKCDDQILGIVRGLLRPGGAKGSTGLNSEQKCAEQTSVVVLRP
jgi:hypothetical protein